MNDTIKKLQEIRRKILEYMYDKHCNDPHGFVSSENLIKDLGFDRNDYNFEINYNLVMSAVKYLEEKGYLKVNRSCGGGFLAQITSWGIDVVEDEEQFNIEFPISINQNIVYGDNLGQVGNHNIQNINIETFEQIYEKIENDDIENSKEIIDMIKRIEKELKKENKNNQNILDSLRFLKSLDFHAGWIFPSVCELIIKSLLGLN